MKEKIIIFFLLGLIGFSTEIMSSENSIQKISSPVTEKEAWQPSKYLALSLQVYLNQVTNFQFRLREGEIFDLLPTPDLEKQYLRGTASGLLSLRNLRSIECTDGEETSKILGDLTQEYKIHLMPKDEDLYAISKMFIEEIKTNTLLQQLIGTVKIKAVTTPDEQLHKEAAIKNMSENQKADWRETDYYDLPRIVIYVGGGREAAQKVLNEIYRIFKNVEGMNRGSGFNQRVTSLIYFAQGNREDKIKEFWNFFEPSLIYYRADVTGTHEDYHLTIPVG